MLCGVEDQDQDAEVGGLVHVGLRRVEERMNLKELGDQRQGQFRVVFAQALEGEKNGALVLEKKEIC